MAEQSHSDSFYGQQQSGPDWGKISEQSALLYEHEDTEEEVKVGADYGAPTDSGWSLCHTADGTPYFYSYELQVMEDSRGTIFFLLSWAIINTCKLTMCVLLRTSQGIKLGAAIQCCFEVTSLATHPKSGTGYYGL